MAIHLALQLPSFKRVKFTCQSPMDYFYSLRVLLSQTAFFKATQKLSRRGWTQSKKWIKKESWWYRVCFNELDYWGETRLWRFWKPSCYQVQYCLSVARLIFVSIQAELELSTQKIKRQRSNGDSNHLRQAQRIDTMPIHYRTPNIDCNKNKRRSIITITHNLLG